MWACRRTHRTSRCVRVWRVCVPFRSKPYAIWELCLRQYPISKRRLLQMSSAPRLSVTIDKTYGKGRHKGPPAWTVDIYATEPGADRFGNAFLTEALTTAWGLYSRLDRQPGGAGTFEGQNWPVAHVYIADFSADNSVLGRCSTTSYVHVRLGPRGPSVSVKGTPPGTGNRALDIIERTFVEDGTSIWAEYRQHMQERANHRQTEKEARRQQRQRELSAYGSSGTRVKPEVAAAELGMPIEDYYKMMEPQAPFAHVVL